MQLRERGGARVLGGAAAAAAAGPAWAGGAGRSRRRLRLVAERAGWRAGGRPCNNHPRGDACPSATPAFPPARPTHLLLRRFMTRRKRWSAASSQVLAHSSMAPNSAPAHSPAAPYSAHSAALLAASASSASWRVPAAVHTHALLSVKGYSAMFRQAAARGEGAAGWAVPVRDPEPGASGARGHPRLLPLPTPAAGGAPEGHRPPACTAASGSATSDRLAASWRASARKALSMSSTAGQWGRGGRAGGACT